MAYAAMALAISVVLGCENPINGLLVPSDSGRVLVQIAQWGSPTGEAAAARTLLPIGTGL